MLGCSCGEMSLLPDGVHGSAQLCADPKPLIALLSLSVGMRHLKQLQGQGIAGTNLGVCWPGGSGAAVLLLLKRPLYDHTDGLGCQCSAHSDTGWESHIQSSVMRRLAPMSHVCDTSGVVAEPGSTSGGLWVTQFGRRPGTWCCCPPVLSHLQRIGPVGTAERWEAFLAP